MEFALLLLNPLQRGKFAAKIMHDCQKKRFKLDDAHSLNK
jgi:hypothetical protein